MRAGRASNQPGQGAPEPSLLLRQASTAARSPGGQVAAEGEAPGGMPARGRAPLAGSPPGAQDRPDFLRGWTLAEIHGIARAAALANKWLVSDFIVRYEAAWDGIIDVLLAAAERPAAHDLARAGKGAVSRGLLKDFCHTYGVANRDLCAGIGSAPQFAAYWHQPGREPAEDKATEMIALGQVMAALGPRDAAILTALATEGDNQAAAAALGIPPSSFSAYATRARKAFAALWFDWEAPSRRGRTPARYRPSQWNMSRLAACGTPGAWRRHKRRGEEVDPACAKAGPLHESQRKKAARDRARARASAGAAA